MTTTTISSRPLVLAATLVVLAMAAAVSAAFALSDAIGFGNHSDCAVFDSDVCEMKIDDVSVTVAASAPVDLAIKDPHIATADGESVHIVLDLAASLVKWTRNPSGGLFQATFEISGEFLDQGLFLCDTSFWGGCVELTSEEVNYILPEGMD